MIMAKAVTRIQQTVPEAVLTAHPHLLPVAAPLALGPEPEGLGKGEIEGVLHSGAKRAARKDLPPAPLPAPWW